MYKLKIDNIIYPLAPNKIDEALPNKNEVINLINSGELNLVKKSGLREYALEFVLPNSNYHFAYFPNGYHNPDYYKNKLIQIKNNAKVIKLIIVKEFEAGNGNKISLGSAISKNVSIEDLSFSDNAEEGFDITVNITFKEYISHKTKTITIKKKKSKVTKKTKKNRNKKSKSKTTGYTVKKGDTLSLIAKKKLGKASRWTEIYKKNKSIIEKTDKKRGRKSSSNGHWIYPGTKLTIPKK